MKFKRSQVEDIHINLTPMIDCLLFILVFLLLTTTFNQFSRMNLTLPDAQGVPPKTFDHKIEVVVDSTGHYSINGQSIAVLVQQHTLEPNAENNDKQKMRESL